MNRRQFSEKIVEAAFMGTAAVRNIFGSEKPDPVVAGSRSSKLVRVNDDVDAAAAREALDRGLIVVTGKSTTVAAWKSLFREDETVGIKLSCVPGIRLSTSRGLVAAICAGLQSAGVKAQRIVVWDRTRRELDRAGFPVNRDGIRYRGTDEYPGWGYSDQVEVFRTIGSCFSLIVKEVDALINVPVLKDHDITGISGGMKNLYGAIHNPNKYHGNNGDPYIADLNTHPIIRGKLRLTICDASRVQIHHGPAFSGRWARDWGGVFLSRDPAALDRVGWEIIETLRSREKLPSLRDEDRQPRYIQSAAESGLGTADLAAIRLVGLKGVLE